VPVIGLVQVGGLAMADRYTYMPMTGLFIIIAWGAGDLAEKWRYKKIILGASAITVISIMAILTFAQGRYWRDSETLFRRAVDMTENNYLAYKCLADALREGGRGDEAAAMYEKAAELDADNAEILNTLAWYLAVSNKAEIREPERAVELARRACELTNYSVAEILDTLAAAYAAAGDFDKAVETAEKAVQLCESPEKEALRKEIEGRAALYKAGKKYTEPLLP
ncbi:MAG: tetratricopeptide repeat protein, partial [Phycisphaerae bacterium]|nr:tetratricopeptide repeat protein [Phycisphaerae bacterium]